MSSSDSTNQAEQLVVCTHLSLSLVGGHHTLTLSTGCVHSNTVGTWVRLGLSRCWLSLNLRICSCPNHLVLCLPLAGHGGLMGEKDYLLCSSCPRERQSVVRVVVFLRVCQTNIKYERKMIDSKPFTSIAHESTQQLCSKINLSCYNGLGFGVHTCCLVCIAAITNAFSFTLACDVLDPTALAVFHRPHSQPYRTVNTHL